MGCTNSKKTEAVVPIKVDMPRSPWLSCSRSEHSNSRTNSPRVCSTPNNVCSNRPSLSEFLSVHPESQILDSTFSEDHCKTPRADASPSSENRPARKRSILESIREQIKQDDIKAKERRMREKASTLVDNRPYQIRVNGMLVAESSNSKRCILDDTIRTPRASSPTGSTCDSVSKRGILKNGPKRSPYRKTSDYTMKTVKIVISGSEQPSSMPDLDSGRHSVDTLRIPTPERMSIRRGNSSPRRAVQRFSTLEPRVSIDKDDQRDEIFGEL